MNCNKKTITFFMSNITLFSHIIFKLDRRKFSKLVGAALLVCVVVEDCFVPRSNTDFEVEKQKKRSNIAPLLTRNRND